MSNGRRRACAALAAAALFAAAPRSAIAQTKEEFETLKRELEQLRKHDEEQRRKLEALERRLDELQKKPVAAEPATAPPAPVAAPAAAEKPSAEAALDQALEQAQTEAPTPRSTDIYSRRVGSAEIRLIDVSMDTLLAAGWSSATDPQIEQLEGGGHDPQQRGFTLQQAEVSFSGAVDPYLTGEAHISAFPDGIELEEAYMTTTSLPYDLQVQAGYFLTDFGIINPLHPHAWDWIDQPIVNTRMFGGDGLRSPGVRVGWLAPLPWYSEVDAGIQNANGGFTTSFDSDQPVGGRPDVDQNVTGLGDLLYLARLRNSWDITSTINAQLGFSGLYGPNSTAGETFLYGTDLKVRWRPVDNFRGWPFLIWQTEAMMRDYTANAYIAAPPPDTNPSFPNDLPGSILRDAGVYTQALYGFTYGWATGLRFEYADGRGDSVENGELVSHNEDSLRDNRFRISPLLSWQPTEFSRFRLQFNYDNTKFLPEKDAYSVWFGAEILYGKHPTHIY